MLKAEKKNIDINIGRRIKNARLMMRLTQSEVASRLGVTVTQIYKYEHGQNSLSAEKIQQFSEILNIPVANFFDQPISPSQIDEHPFFTATANSRNKILAEDVSTLLQLFTRIKSGKARQTIIELVRLIRKDAA
jgi:transcriptional regulator with XRE-family HTH domain